MNGAIMNSWKSTDKYQEWLKHCNIQITRYCHGRETWTKIIWILDFIDLLYHRDWHNFVRTTTLTTNAFHIDSWKILQNQAKSDHLQENGIMLLIAKRKWPAVVLISSNDEYKVLIY